MAEEKRKLPEVLEHDFVITDETVNRYKWRLLVSGIDLSAFLLNPVCCLEHQTMMIPVGKWKNLRIEGSKLSGTVEFDRNDPEAVRLYWKYKDGYMNAVSLHVAPVEESDDPELLLPGQKYPTLVKSEMLEISLVTLPAQRNAIKLSAPEGGEYKLHLLTNTLNMAKEENTVEQLQKELSEQRKLNAGNLIRIHQQRGVVSDGEIEPLTELALSNYENVSKMLDARTVPEKKVSTENNADDLIRLHFNRGAIGESEKEIFRLSAVSNFDKTKKVLEARPGKEGVATFMNNLTDQGEEKKADEKSGWSYYDYFRKDPYALSLIKENEPEKYKKLVSDFEKESLKMGIGY